jgi:hypothetical protein
VGFAIVTLWEIPVILTANYTFLNYLVLSLGFLLLDDAAVMRFVPERWRPRVAPAVPLEIEEERETLSILAGAESPGLNAESRGIRIEDETGGQRSTWKGRRARHGRALGLAVSAVMLTWIGYNTAVEMIRLGLRRAPLPLPMAPVAALEPFRIANQYGLFAVMTRGRYEIEFQGSDDGENWTPYLFRNKPQLLNEAPRIYAPYQPRFDWNLWFASLGDWRESQIVPLTEERLLENSKDVVALFKGNPFGERPPRYVRAVLWQYWFTSIEEKRSTGNWWRRQLLGMYAPEITRTAEGRFAVVAWPDELEPHE